MNNTWVIGYLHGGLSALIQLLERAPVLENDEFIFLGDYVDGWSESAQLVDFLMDLENRFRCVFIKGNHDVYCRNWLENGKKDPIWLKHGGLSTIESYRDISEEKKTKHLDFLKG